MYVFVGGGVRERVALVLACWSRLFLWERGNEGEKGIKDEGDTSSKETRNKN
jgi:hypothetical protein